MAKSKKKPFELKIETLGKEGFGRGYVTLEDQSRREVEVPYTLPGETVKAEYRGRYRGVWRSSLQEILTPSPDRKAPKCIHFGKCGGCRWQHMSYEKQLGEKEKYLIDFMKDFLSAGAELRPIIPCDPPWEYRNKMEFSFSSNKAGDRYLGLMMQGGAHHVLNLDVCHLVNSWFIDVLKAVKNWWDTNEIEAYHMPSNKGALRTLTVREGQRTGDKMVMLSVSGNPEFALTREQIESFTQCIHETIGDERVSIFLRIQQIQKGQPTQFYEMHLAGPDHIIEELYVEVDCDRPAKTVRFQISPTAFFQPNTRQAEKLYSTALQLVKLNKDDVVYDLCCGIGTLGICAAPHVQEVVGVEIVYESILDARNNAAENGCGNVTFHHGDIAEVLNRLKEEGWAAPRLAIVDPPRAGLEGKSLQQLVDLNPEEILYISCSPKSQARDLALLLEKGYVCTTLQPVDQFPHTIHLENIALLKRKDLIS